MPIATCQRVDCCRIYSVDAFRYGYLLAVRIRTDWSTVIRQFGTVSNVSSTGSHKQNHCRCLYRWSASIYHRVRQSNRLPVDFVATLPNRIAMALVFQICNLLFIHFSRFQLSACLFARPIESSYVDTSRGVMWTPQLWPTLLICVANLVGLQSKTGSCRLSCRHKSQCLLIIHYSTDIKKTETFLQPKTMYLVEFAWWHQGARRFENEKCLQRPEKSCSRICSRVKPKAKI